MNIENTKLAGVFIIETPIFKDERGDFIKTFHQDFFKKNGLDFKLAESYFSVSEKNVIRGMHFQAPPAEHAKMVYVTQGKILDVVLDIRAGSPTYGQYLAVEISAENPKMLFISPGFAHGFLALENNSCVTYLLSSVHSPEHDQGVHIDSFDMDWGVKNPILSKRDQGFPRFEKFKSPFQYKKNETPN
ncbi:dTDP-4-dehydrorhamnose 3,5-epimerase [Candidatus Parcubacteria bacterium]|nr:MAG: dTDP-4-dehydrorhamnose 3,5-epimerase [Candidatus Parcubacteria bacterium]